MTRKSLEDFEWQAVDSDGRPMASREKFPKDIFLSVVVMITSFMATILFLLLIF